MINEFDPSELKKLYQPAKKSSGEDNGQVTVIGGSSLFHGAPILALKVASRIVDMVFFASPEKSVGRIAEKAKSKLMSFIWVPWEDLEKYVDKSDAVLIGPGFMRFSSEKKNHGERYHICDEACQMTKNITEDLLKKFPDKKWVIDAGSLQAIDETLIPTKAILTPNAKEFNLLFKIKDQKFIKKNIKEKAIIVKDKAGKHNCIIVLKGSETIVASSNDCVIVKGGNPGMTKGGTGDVHAGLTVALLAKNEPFLAASSAAYLIKAAADKLFNKAGVYYSASDLGDETPSYLASLLK